MAEIRLDLCDLDEDDIEDIFLNSDIPLVATCRIARPGNFDDETLAEGKLLKAIEAGARYADLEIEASSRMGRRIRQACGEYGTILIRSWHDFQGTPPEAILLSTLEKCRRFGGEIVKIATTATSEADCERIMGLYREAEPGTLVAFAMGQAGRESRLEALRKGAPFTYAALTESEATAPGQWSASEMRKAVYGDFRFIDPSAPIRMPSSKSFAQRAIIAAALAAGTSHLYGYSSCGDNEAAIGVARALGADVSTSGDILTITGTGARPRSMDIGTVHAGESGLTARMAIPILASIAKGPVAITGEGSLTKRPLAGAHDIMASFGVILRPDEPRKTGRKEDVTVPLTVSGPLIAGRADIDGRGGSQLISGLLAALPMEEGKSVIFVHEPRSIPYMFITMDVLRKFGIRIDSEMEGGDDFLETQEWTLCSGINFRIKGGQRYMPADFAIECDWSAAANFMAAGAIFGSVELEGLDSQSLQADISIMDILIDAGAGMSQLEGATPSTGPIRVTRAPLKAFDTGLENCPDLFPIVSVLAAFCEGESHITGVGRLRHKETDRAAAIVEMLTGMGVPAEIADDTLIINGMGLTRRILTGNLLRGGKFTSHGDHRMVMALRVASLGASSPVEIDDTACVAKSYPLFNETFGQLLLV